MGKKKYHELFFGLTLNEDQERLRDAIFDDQNQVIIVDSVAGSGKTLISVACAKQLVSNNPESYDGCVFIFSTPEEGSLGFRPGTTAEKESDYLEPLYDALIKIGEIPMRVISSDVTEKNGTAWITARSATFLRGTNFYKKVVVIDEAQNNSVQILKRIISRAHDNCKVIILGCQAQTDVPLSKSGFRQLLEHMKSYPRAVQINLPISYRGDLAMWIDKL